MPSKLSLLVVCMLLGAIAACGGGSKPSVAPQPGAPSPAATDAVLVPDATEPTASSDGFKIGAAADFPPDVALIIETGCWQCDGPSTGLVRVRRTASRTIVSEPLFRHSFESAAFSADASQVALGVCTRGYCGGVGERTADAQTSILWSRDGGVTFQTFGPFNGAYGVVGIANRGILVAGPEQYPADPPLFYIPSHEPVSRPPGAVTALVLGDGELTWLTKDRSTMIAADGIELLNVGAGHTIYGALPQDASAARVSVTWGEALISTGYRYHMTVLMRDAAGAHIESDRLLPNSFGLGASSIDEQTQVGNVSLSRAQVGGFPTETPFTGFLPAIFDLRALLIHPIVEPFATSGPFGRNIVRAAVRGPFTAVANTGSCLNLRSEPAATARSLDCAADGVLLRTLGEERAVGGATWLRVAAPAGVEGWASAEFLAR